MKTTKSKAKIQEGDLIKLTIESMSTEAQGVAKHQNRVYFVSGAVTGDEVLAQIERLKKNYAICKAVKILKDSPHLNPDYGKYQDQQGGCSILRLNYPQQLEAKLNEVSTSFSTIAHINIATQLKMHPSHTTYRYRNKAIYPAGHNPNANNGQGGIDFGYYLAKSHDLIFSHDSIIEHRQNADILKAICKFCHQHNLEAYDETRHQGLIRSVLLRSNHQNQHLVCLIINAVKFPFLPELAHFLKERFQNVIDVGVVFNPRKTNVHLTSNFCLYFNTPFYDVLGDYQYEISPNSFFQINRPQATALYQRVVELADIKPDDVVWDIYCGVGTISAWLAKSAKYVLGNEYVEEAVENASRNMKLNGINNVAFQAGLAEVVIPAWLAGEGVDRPEARKPNIIVLDPPRKGADRKVLEAIVSADPDRIVYVSCKPSTLARDVEFLVQNGYHLDIIEAFDFFPHTMHVESVVLMTRVAPTKSNKV